MAKIKIIKDGTGGQVLPVTIQEAIINKDTKKNLVHDLSLKVDKVTGKELSTNDYTTTEKNKLRDIESGAQKNVNITKGEIEAKLTGDISSHKHSYGGKFEWVYNANTESLDLNYIG